MQTPQTSAAEIAADVARRYGVVVAAGAVQICPPRTFSTSTPVWDARTKTLVYPDADARKAALKKQMWAGAAAARAAAKDPVIVARRADLARLHGEGLTVRAISEALQISYATASNDHQLQQLAPNEGVSVATTQSALRADRIRDLHAEGWTVARIAALLGVAHDTVRDLARKYHGIRFARRVAVPRALRVARAPRLVVAGAVNTGGPVVGGRRCPLATAARRADVARMYTAGATWTEMSRSLGIAMSTVFYDLQHLGLRRAALPGDPMHPERMAQSQADRAAIAAGMAAGKTNKAIAAECGLHHQTVSRIRCAIARERRAAGTELAPELAPELGVAA